jgi:hypothetical protein
MLVIAPLDAGKNAVGLTAPTWTGFGGGAGTNKVLVCVPLQHLSEEMHRDYHDALHVWMPEKTMHSGTVLFLRGGHSHSDYCPI